MVFPFRNPRGFVGFTPKAGPVAHSVKSHNGEEKILKTLKCVTKTPS